ncbi:MULTISPECIES: TMEM143 family protein [unclassified Moorena]|uniref:TMEM143 family protein n=1 Tax=unclassified Moorena TaxID=2683338 RepID=UPI0033907146
MMAIYQDREAFIPYRRTDLIELCLEDGKLDPTNSQKFRDFCEILSAYYHFNFHETLENLKDNFAPFNPDADTKSIKELTPDQKSERETKLISTLTTLLKSANYFSLPKNILEQAVSEHSLIELKTEIDFDDFEELVCYGRGDKSKIYFLNKLLKPTEQNIEIYERVVLLIKFKDKSYFESKKSKKLENLNFIPGKMYVYLYGNIPKFDLEFLFPNVKIGMTWKDRLLFGLPAIGAAIPLLVKVLPQLIFILGIILFAMGVESFRIDQEKSHDIMAVLLTTLSVVIAFGGFAFKQYTSYQNKQIKFQKSVTETLFFKNLAINAGVFKSLIDDAEEEECKEIILVYYHLLTSKKLLNPKELDNHIEAWMDDKFDTKIDFDINNCLRNLEEIEGKIVKDNLEQGSRCPIPLLTYDHQGRCQVLPLQEAKTLIDYVWDNAFG